MTSGPARGPAGPGTGRSRRRDGPDAPGGVPCKPARSALDTVGDGYVSTGQLPVPERVMACVDQAYQRFKDVAGGANSTVSPALAAAPGGLFGVCLATTSGRVHAAGDAEWEFPIMDLAKPFLFALICRHFGVAAACAQLGVASTGLPADAVSAIERSEDGRTNPMATPGAIAATCLAPGASPAARWRFIRDGLSSFAGRPLVADPAAPLSDPRQHSIVRLLRARGHILLDPAEAAELYARQCALAVSAMDLAVMAATLADGGVNPLTRERVVDGETCRCVLAVMATAGFYQASGAWLCDVGLPGKSGITGGIVAVAPGKAGLGTFAPPLGLNGSSVKGRLALGYLATELGLNLFLSQAAP